MRLDILQHPREAVLNHVPHESFVLAGVQPACSNGAECAFKISKCGSRSRGWELFGMSFRGREKGTHLFSVSSRTISLAPYSIGCEPCATAAPLGYAVADFAPVKNGVS